MGLSILRINLVKIIFRLRLIISFFKVNKLVKQSLRERLKFKFSQKNQNFPKINKNYKNYNFKNETKINNR